jgi:hypothetical protein
MIQLRCALVAIIVVTGCAGTALSDHDRFRQALVKAPEMITPVAGKADPIPSGSWDSQFRMISYSHAATCFLAQWSVPPELAPTLQFKLAGWRSLDDGETAPTITSASVEVLSAEMLAKVTYYDGYVNRRAKLVTLVERPDKAQAMYDTAMRVCFSAPATVLASARYVVITVDADAHHRTGAGWKLVPQ